MKKLILSAYILIICTTSKAQVYVSLGWSNNGATMGAGALYKHIDASFLYDTDFNKRGKKNVSFNIGRAIMLSHWGEDDWLVTPIVGVAETYYKIYNSCRYIPPVETTETHPVYGFEFGQNLMDGRFVFIYKHSNSDYYGASIRVNIIQLAKTKRPWRK